MFPRVVFVVIASFWVVMNVLLWRKEFGPGTSGTTRVAMELVWGRVLTSPDSPSIAIIYQGKNV